MFKDESISKRHRLWGWNVPIVDIDFLKIENNKFIEFKELNGLERIKNTIKNNKGLGTNYTASKFFADSCLLEYYICIYDKKDIIVFPANKLAKNNEKSNFKVKKEHFKNFIFNKIFEKNILSDNDLNNIDLLKHIDKTFLPKNTISKFDYKVTPERSNWRDENLDLFVDYNDVKSFLGLEYDKGKPTRLVEYIDTSKNILSLKERNVFLNKINVPLISFYYDSEELKKSNILENKVVAENELALKLFNNFKTDKWIKLNDNTFKLKESYWIFFLYKIRGYSINNDYAIKIKQEIDNSFKYNIKKNLEYN